MGDEEKVEPDYLRGFNEGYTIAQSMPELAEQLANIDSDFIRMVGFKHGREQCQKEQLKERLPAWLKSDRPSKEQQEPPRSIDRDIEPDK